MSSLLQWGFLSISSRLADVTLQGSAGLGVLTSWLIGEVGNTCSFGWLSFTALLVFYLSKWQIAWIVSQSIKKVYYKLEMVIMLMFRIEQLYWRKWCFMCLPSLFMDCAYGFSTVWSRWSIIIFLIGLRTFLLHKCWKQLRNNILITSSYFTV